MPFTDTHWTKIEQFINEQAILKRNQLAQAVVALQAEADVLQQAIDNARNRADQVLAIQQHRAKVNEVRQAQNELENYGRLATDVMDLFRDHWDVLEDEPTLDAAIAALDVTKRNQGYTNIVIAAARELGATEQEVDSVLSGLRR